MRRKGIVRFHFINLSLFLLGILLVCGSICAAFSYAHSDEPADVLDVILRPDYYVMYTGCGLLALAVMIELAILVCSLPSRKRLPSDTDTQKKTARG